MRIVGADGFGQDIVNPDGFHDRTDRAAGDDSGTLGCGLEHDMTGTEATQNLVRNGPIQQLDLLHVLFGPIRCLANGIGNLIGLSETESHGTVSVADNDQGAEAESPTALDHLGNTIQINDLFNKFQFVLLNERPLLQFDSGFTGTVGQSLDPAVVHISVAVENC